jgi:RNA polymerase sigma factor (sigma-70 family)
LATVDRQRKVTHPEPRAVKPDSEALELALLRRVAAGDDEAFVALYQRYRPRIQAFLRRLLADPLQAEEIADDVMVVVWRDAARFEQRSKLSTWIFGIAYRQAAKALRRRPPPHVPLEGHGFTVPDGASAVEARQWVETALRYLSADHRLVVELTFVNGFSYQEIAEIAGCPVNTVKTRMFHARRKLKNLLSSLAHPNEDESS